MSKRIVRPVTVVYILAAAVLVTYTYSSSASFFMGSSILQKTLSRLSGGARNNSCTSNILVQTAKDAIQAAENEFRLKPKVVDPNSNDNTANQESIAVAKHFLAKTNAEFLDSFAAKDEDRLVKVGRSIVDLFDIDSDDSVLLTQGLTHIIESTQILSHIGPNTEVKVPTVRFGKTELQMPIVTLGTMRYQQTWGGNINDMEKIDAKGQENLLAIMRHAIKNLGINHIECARGYGSSELQTGAALQQLFKEGEVKREDLIIQTKINAMNPKLFRETIEKSFAMLQVDYIDLFSFHGLNLQYHYDLIFNNPSGGENLMDIVNEYKAQGKIRHIGFSTHAQPKFIVKCIETDAFEYANVHYHAFGSYTASGGGDFGGNKEVVRLMKEKDMGIFVISPYDKGGRLYAPSKKLRSLTLPEFEPMTYGSMWLFGHQYFDEEHAPIHTFTVGAARPSDLDESVIAALQFNANPTGYLGQIEIVSERLRAAEIESFGEQWVNSWWHGVPQCDTDNDMYQFGQIVWLHNVIKAWGMLDFAKDRYATFDGNLEKWDFSKNARENIANMRGRWGYMPGLAYDPSKDYSDFLKDVPEENKERVLEAIKFVHYHCSSSSEKENDQILPEWKEAFDMRPWTAFPERK